MTDFSLRRFGTALASMFPLRFHRCFAALACCMAALWLTSCARHAAPYRWARATTADPKGGNEDFIWIEPGQSRTIADLKGPGEITSLWMTADGFAQKESNRQVVLRITWDDTPGASVLVPVGDFFNVARGRVQPYESAFVSVQDTGSLNAFFRMPFRRRALIQLENQSQDRQRYYAAVTWERRAVASREMYFHAQYRQEKPATPLVPYTVADISGRGAYLGHHLNVVLNGGGWWGEGDDNYIVDGERFEGTGTEDAFGHAWGFSGRGGTLRSGVAQVMNGFERNGFWNLYDFHNDAPIPFQKHFRLEFEHGLNGFDARPGMENNYSSVAFYYLRKPQVQPPLPPLKDRMLGAIPIAGPLPGGWYEAENAVLDSQFFALRGAVVSAANRPKDGGWSGDADASLVALKTGDRFVWALDLPTTGTLTPQLAMTRQPSGFDFAVYMNGKPLNEKISGHADVQTRDVVALPAIHANAGRNMIEFVSRGADPRTTPPAFHANIDAIRFLPSNESNAIDVRPQVKLGEGGRVLHRLIVENAKLYDRGDDCDEAPLDADLLDANDAIRFRNHEDKIALNSPHNTELGRELEVAFLLHAEPTDKNAVLFSRNQVMASWVNKGKLVVWLRDLDWRFLYLETREGIIPDREWCSIRIAHDGVITRLFVNGALCAESDMRVFDNLNQYPGPLVLGGSANQQSPFRGEIARFTMRAGRPLPPAGEE